MDHRGVSTPPQAEGDGDRESRRPAHLGRVAPGARHLAVAAVAVGAVLLAGLLACHGLVGGGSDADVARRVQAKLVPLASTAAGSLRVHSVHGVVRLSGVVDSPGRLLEAERLARHTQGVRDVVNDLTLSAGRDRGAEAAVS
jgi:hypothetical protein